MEKKLVVRPLGRLARLADILMIPIMRIIIGTWNERPQQTHFWNNTKFRNGEEKELDPALMVTCEGLPDEAPRSELGRHLTWWGGWKRYIMLHPPVYVYEWHVGWITDSVKGVSRIKLVGPVRVLRGPSKAQFFGIDAETGEQIEIEQRGREGVIGDGSFCRRIPLL